MSTEKASRLRLLTLDLLESYGRVGAGWSESGFGAGAKSAAPRLFDEWRRRSTTTRVPGRPPIVPRRSLTAPNVSSGGGNEGRDNARGRRHSFQVSPGARGGRDSLCRPRRS